MGIISRDNRDYHSDPFPHSLLSTRESLTGFEQHAVQLEVMSGLGQRHSNGKLSMSMGSHAYSRQLRMSLPVSLSCASKK